MQRLSSVVKEKVEAYVASGVQEERKIELLDNLSVAVETVQSKFENPIHNKAVKEGKEVENLCSCLEDIFQHGLKEKGIQGPSKASESLSFWTVIQKLSIKEDIQSIYRLSIVQTDVNRCRAWIRMKLKDHTIGSYIGMLSENSRILKEHYYANAFLRDAVKTESVRTLLQYVIASLDFYISVESSDRYFLRKPSLDRSYSSASPDIDVRHEAFQSEDIIKHRKSSKKKSRTPIVNIASMRDHDSMSHASSDRSSDRSSRSSSVVSPGLPRYSAVSIAVNQAEPEVEVKYLEGSSLKSEGSLNAADSGGKTADIGTQKSVNRSLSVDRWGKRADSKARSSSSGSSRSRSSIDSQRDTLFDSSISSAVPSSHSGKSTGSFKWSDTPAECRVNGGVIDTEPYSDTSASSSSHVLSEQQKDELVEMIRSLRLNSNKPLTTGKVLEMIPVQKGMSRDEVKSYIEECMRDYFSMGIITTMQKSPLRKPIKTESDKDGGFEGSGKDSRKHERPDAGEINETKSESLEQFLSGGRAMAPLWSSSQADVANPRTLFHSVNELSLEDGQPVTVNNGGPASFGRIDNEVLRDETRFEGGVDEIALNRSSQLASQVSENITAANNIECNGLEIDQAKGNSPPNHRSAVLHDLSEGGVDHKFTDKLLCADHLSSRNFANENSASDPGLLRTKELPTAEKPNGLEKPCFASETSAFRKPCNAVGRSQSTDDTGLGIKEDLIDNLESNGKDIASFGNELIAKTIDQDLSADDEPNFVPGIHDDQSAHAFSQAKPITRSRKANTIGHTGNRQSTPKSGRGPKSLDRETPGKQKIRLPSSTEAADLLYGFRVKSPTFDSTHSSIDTSQGYLFDDNDYVTDSDADTYTTGENNERDRIRSLLADLGVNDDIVGMKEDHFATPDSFMGFTNDEELDNAIETCKERIKSLSPQSEERRHLVIKLVQLRLKKHELKEAPSEDSMHVKKILGHHFSKQGKAPGNYFCDSCGATIWALLHTLYKCQDCSFHCHRKCLESVDKPCVSSKICGSVYIADITPECGLATQQYRCADCRRRLLFRDGCFQARLCDYTGQFYCSNCHWNETQVIPARVIHNWDFVPRKISRQSKHLLNLLSLKPIIFLKKMNPALFNFVEDLRDVRALREQILSMKKYLVSCRIAVEEKLLLMLKDRQHFVENSDMYTMQDLMNIENGKLLEELSRVTASFGKHIKFDCLICQGRGFICEICPSTDVIFPFDFNSLSCPECVSLFHRSCYRKGNCPKCKRIASRRSVKEDNLRNLDSNYTIKH